MDINEKYICFKMVNNRLYVKKVEKGEVKKNFEEILRILRYEEWISKSE